MASNLPEAKRMHSTPDLPGTSPVTDDPNPGGTEGSDPLGPGTDTDVPEQRKAPVPDTRPKPTERKSGTE
jgi:hypothetical protein